MGMAGPPLSRKESAAQRRNAILEAAKTVFARQGYPKTIVEDIAAQAGIGKGTLYLYFSSKEEIYLAALLTEARQMDRETREAMAAATTWQEMLRAYIQVRLRYFDEHQDFLRIYMTEFRSMCMQGKPLNAELHHLFQENEARLAQVFAAAAARGEMRSVDPQLAALTVTDLTRGLMERRLRGWLPAGNEDADFVVDLLCRAFEK